MIPCHDGTYNRHTPWLPPHVEQRIEERRRLFEETLVYLNQPRMQVPAGARIFYTKEE